MTEVRKLISQLGNFRTRATAMEQLLLLGDAALEALVDALASPLDGTRWAAATTLGRLGDPHAAKALARLRDDPVVGEAARKALHAIHVATSPSAVQKREAGTRTDDELFEALIRGAEAFTITGSGTARTLQVALADARRQKVRVDLAVSDYDGEPLVVAFTVCGPAKPALYEQALRLNMKMRFGAVGLIDIGGEGHFVLVDAHRRGGLDIQALRRSVRELAERGDAMEKVLTGEDRR